MKRWLALIWLICTATAAMHVVTVLIRGLPIQTDLMALLPAEAQNPEVAAATAEVSARLADRVVVLVGDANPAAARAAAARLRHGLVADGVITIEDDVPSPEALARLGRYYFDHRGGLLAEADRQALTDNHGSDLVTRALSQIYGVGGTVDARLLRNDPFMLLPAFMTALPMLNGRMQLVEGWPCVTDDGATWVLLSAHLAGSAYTLADQDRFIEAWERHTSGLPQSVRLLRMGAVFYAHAGAAQALAETSTIGAVSIVGTLALILLVFRALSPLLLSGLAIAVGLACATSISLLIFDNLHVIALTFGASLIGVAVDYSLHYFGRAFSEDGGPWDRLRHVGPGLALGLSTSLLGYAAIGFAPLPGLHQVAVFSTVGLIAAFTSVVLWFPWLDRTRARTVPSAVCLSVARYWGVWDKPRGSLLVMLALLGLWGGLQFSTSDDVRNQQNLDPGLVAEQEKVQALVGVTSATQFFLITADDDETALQRAEALGSRLEAVRTAGGLGNWMTPARFVPSLERQMANAVLVRARLLDPFLESYIARIGLSAAGAAAGTPARLEDLSATNALPFLTNLSLTPGRQIVVLDAPTDLAALSVAANEIPGVHFVDPAADVSAILSHYRERAIWVLCAAVLAIAPLLLWRYGLRGGLISLAPPLSAVALTPLLLAAAGVPFSFFTSMALVLVLSIGVDYAVFCAEAGETRDPATAISTWLATVTTALAFGLLALSGVAAVHAFGMTMLIGLALSLLFAPFAGRVHGAFPRKNPE